MRDMNCAGPLHFSAKRISEKEVKKEIVAFGRKYRFCSLECYKAWRKAEFGIWGNFLKL